MPHCPECRANYEEGIAKCSDCGGELRPGDTPEDELVDWVVVRDVATDAEAELIAGLLEAEDILVSVEDRGSSSLPETIGELAEVLVMVPSERKDEALRILAQHEKDYAGSANAEAVVTDDGPAEIGESDADA